MTPIRESQADNAIYRYSSDGPRFGQQSIRVSGSTCYTNSQSYYFRPAGMPGYYLTGASSVKMSEMEVFYVY